MIPPFNKLLNPDEQNFVAINLGNYSIKGLMVKANKITDFFLKERQDLSAALREIWQEKKISTNRVKLSLKDPAMLVRYFSFPKLEKKKIKQTLFYELNKHIPFSPDEVYFDFSILEETSPTEVFIVLAVAKKDFINAILELFEKEKLKVLDITLDSLCLINLFLRTEEQKETNSCILDIGSSFSALTILRKSTPFLTRDLAFSTKDIFNVLSNIKNIPFAETEKWVTLPQNHKEVLELAQDSIVTLCKEVKSSFDYFEVNKGERIERLYLTGGIAYLTGIGSVFKDYLDIEVSSLDKIQNLNISFSDKNFDSIRNSFSVALGLAL